MSKVDDDDVRCLARHAGEQCCGSLHLTSLVSSPLFAFQQHSRRGRSRKRRSSPYFDEQAVRDACRREARRESRRESRRERDPRERDLREVNGKMREDRRREREALKETETLEEGGKAADDVGASGGKEHEREHREHRRHKSRHMSVDLQATSLADGVVGVGMAGAAGGVPGPPGGGDGFQTTKERQREERRRERERERLRSRDAYRDRERERLDTRDSTRERKTRERLTSRERSDRESKERERLHSRDHKRDWDLQLPPSALQRCTGHWLPLTRYRARRTCPSRVVGVPNCAPAGRGVSYQGSQPPMDGRHLPTLASSETPKASRLIAFPTLASDDGTQRQRSPRVPSGASHMCVIVVCRCPVPLPYSQRWQQRRGPDAPAAHARQLHPVHADPQDSCAGQQVVVWRWHAGA